ncbi:formate/nitrite transporter family protein [Desulfobulbus sp. US2]|nr:formate/nitrite transporter family protein [Desulfobulbus sp. US2]
MEQIQRPFLSLALSSVAAALILSFSVMAVAVMSTLMIDLQQPLLARFAMALVYPLGFIICIMSGTELFTEHTATAVYPVLEGKADRLQLLRLWAIVFFGEYAWCHCWCASPYCYRPGDSGRERLYSYRPSSC